MTDNALKLQPNSIGDNLMSNVKEALEDIGRLIVDVEQGFGDPHTLRHAKVAYEALSRLPAHGGVEEDCEHGCRADRVFDFAVRALVKHAEMSETQARAAMAAEYQATPVSSQSDDQVEAVALEIDGFYEDASNNPCTCNIDENSCPHCNAWEAARRKTRTAIASLSTHSGNAQATGRG
jgi:hypothetical protein